MSDALLKVAFFCYIQNQGTNIEVYQTGELEDVDQHLFRLVFIDGLRDFKQGLQLQFFPLVFVTIRLHVRGYCEPLSPFLWPNT